MEDDGVPVWLGVAALEALWDRVVLEDTAGLPLRDCDPEPPCDCVAVGDPLPVPVVLGDALGA